MPQNTLALSDVSQIVASVSPIAVAAPTFNQGIILGLQATLPTVGANSRCRQYTSLAGMVADGFSTTSAEYLSATQYFAQSPAPQYLWVGRQDTSALSNAAITSGAAGTGYVVGDIVTVVQGAAQAGTIQVTSIAAGGVVSGIQVVSGAQGTGYTAGTGLATTGGHGTGLQVTLTGTGETPVQAVTACRNASSAWYGAYLPLGADVDQENVTAYLETANPKGLLFFDTIDPNTLAGLTPNVGSVMSAANYRHALGFYATTQSGAYPSNAYLGAGVMGLAMGLNSGLAGSYFTIAGKTLTGLATEPITQAQFNTLASQKLNAYLKFGNAFSFIENGVTPSGAYFDQVLFQDMLTADLQTACANVIAQNTAVPMNDSGQQLFINAAVAVCNKYVSIGYIAPGIYNGPALVGQGLNLTVGQSLLSGFLVQSPGYAYQTAANRAARIGQPLYVTVCEAESAQSITIGLNIQQ